MRTPGDMDLSGTVLCFSFFPPFLGPRRGGGGDETTHFASRAVGQAFWQYGWLKYRWGTAAK